MSAGPRASACSGSSSRRLPTAICLAAFWLPLLIGVWSARLAVYLLLDRVLGQPEEGRYRALRQRWGAAAGREALLFLSDPGPGGVVFLPCRSWLSRRHPRRSLDRMGSGRCADLVRQASATPSWPTGNSPDSSGDRTAAARRAARAGGDTRATRTTSSNGCTGGPTWRWRSGRPTGGLPCWPRP